LIAAIAFASLNLSWKEAVNSPLPSKRDTQQPVARKMSRMERAKKWNAGAKKELTVHMGA